MDKKNNTAKTDEFPPMRIMTNKQARDYLGVKRSASLYALLRRGLIRRIDRAIWDADSVIEYKKLRDSRFGGRYLRDDHGNRIPGQR